MNETFSGALLYLIGWVDLLLILLKGFLFLFILEFIATAFYNVYFHPLCKYPGPRYAVTSNLVYWFVVFHGETVAWTQKLHEQYGPIVRLGPNRLSYTSPDAWKDIYGYQTSNRKRNPKDRTFYLRGYNGATSILSTFDPGEHGAIRKIFSHAFSEKALKLQEPLIRTYVDQLISNVRRVVAKDPDSKIPIVKLYNCTTFDIMGDLTFSEPLGLLNQSEYTPWVSAVFGNVKAGEIARIQLEYPLIGKILSWYYIPKSLWKQRKEHFEQSAERVNRRYEKGTDKPDIWNLVLQKGQGHLSLGQMHSNAATFMVAGTETTATLLSGLTYYLLKSPETLQRAVKEIRALSEEDLSLEVLPRLPYFNACIEEALRCYPPVAIGVPREIVQGGAVTRLSVHHMATYLSPENFKNPDAFIPERWLPGTGYDTDRKDALHPFSFGPHTCLGRNLAYHEVRIIMAKMLYNFDLKLCAGNDNWREQKCFQFWQKSELWIQAKLAH